MAHKPVGVNTFFTLSSGSSVRGVTALSQQSDTLRVVAKGAGAHVAIGTLPEAATTNYYVAAGEPETISLGGAASQRVVGITTGTTTTLDFPEGTGSPFVAGNAVSLTVTGASGQENFNFSHKIVSSVDNSAGVGGYYSTRVVVDYDSSSVTDTLLSNSYAELRGSFMVAAYGDGSGTFHYQQVQHT
jgi:hypothetical protein